MILLMSIWKAETNGKLRKKSRLPLSKWRKQRQSTPKKAALFPKCIDIFTIA